MTTKNLDEIIDGSTGGLRPFTKEDWYGYAGCESEEPEIGEAIWGEVVLDGTMVCAVVAAAPMIGDDEPEDEFEQYAGTFPTEASARLVAETLLEVEAHKVSAYLERVN